MRSGCEHECPGSGLGCSGSSRCKVEEKEERVGESSRMSSGGCRIVFESFRLNLGKRRLGLAPVSERRSFSTAVEVVAVEVVAVEEVVGDLTVIDADDAATVPLCVEVCFFSKAKSDQLVLFLC